MTLSIRRVVTGHDEEGKAVVKFDEISGNTKSFRPGHASCVIWTTDSTPDDLQGAADAGLKPVSTVNPAGSVFRIVEYEPGVTPRNHRTDSVDYAIVMKGEIDMHLDDSVVTLRQGDVLVQRGTVHNWVNKGAEPCVIGFVLIHSELPEFGGAQLQPEG